MLYPTAFSAANYTGLNEPLPRNTCDKYVSKADIIGNNKTGNGLFDV